jgi:hypothetical protein
MDCFSDISDNSFVISMSLPVNGGSQRSDDTVSRREFVLLHADNLADGSMNPTIGVSLFRNSNVILIAFVTKSDISL